MLINIWYGLAIPTLFLLCYICRTKQSLNNLTDSGDSNAGIYIERGASFPILNYENVKVAKSLVHAIGQTIGIE